METINSLEIYRDAGEKAGRAAKRRDMSTANFHSQWLSRALRLESECNRPACREAFNTAYKAEATPT